MRRVRGAHRAGVLLSRRNRWRPVRQTGSRRTRSRGCCCLTALSHTGRPRTVGHWAAKNGWMVGAAGPFLRGEQPTTRSLGATFSRFEKVRLQNDRQPCDCHSGYSRGMAKNCGTEWGWLKRLVLATRALKPLRNITNGVNKGRCTRARATKRLNLLSLPQSLEPIVVE